MLQGWHFDLGSGLITVIVLPFALFLGRILLRYLKQWGAYALEGFLYWAGRTLKHSLAASLTLKRYARLQLAGSSKFLHVPSSQDIRLEIDSVYVPLTLEHHGSEQRNYSHLDVLTLGNRIRVVGDPGSGKSSLVKRLFRDGCLAAVDRSSKARLPVLLELKTLTLPAKLPDGELGSWFYKKLRADAAKNEAYRMDECFDSFAQTTGLLVLLDGLDEVGTASYPRVQSAILGLSRELARSGGENVIVLTMRTQFHQQMRHAYQEAFPNTLFLKSFTPSDIYDFLTRWPFPSNRGKNIERIYGELTDRPTLREMCSNPLVLSMYVAEDQAAGHVSAPESRTDFYKKVTEELLLRRRLQQTGPTQAASKLREQRERILGRLAYDHLLDPTQPTNSLQLHDALRAIRDVAKCGPDEAAALFQEIAKETGIVTEEQPGESFRFIHLTFCEFLAAFEAVQGQADGFSTLLAAHERFQNLAQPFLQSRLVEVIPFASGLLPRIKRAGAIDLIVRTRDHRLLARSFLETKLYEHAAWPEFLSREQLRLARTPDNEWDDDWLRDLHLFNLVVRDATECSLHIPTAGVPVDLEEFTRALLTKRTGNLQRLLAAYATQDAAAAFRVAELCHLDLPERFPDLIVANCDQAPFLALVRGRAATDTARVELWASLLAESALQSQIVSRQLRAEKPLAEWRHATKRVDRKWWMPPLAGYSLLTQCFTIAARSSVCLEKGLLCVRVLRQVPPPTKYRIESILFRLLPLVLVFIAGSMLMLIRRRVQIHTYKEVALIGVNILLYCGFFLELHRWRAIRMLYREAVSAFTSTRIGAIPVSRVAGRSVEIMVIHRLSSFRRVPITFATLQFRLVGSRLQESVAVLRELRMMRGVSGETGVGAARIDQVTDTDDDPTLTGK